MDTMINIGMIVTYLLLGISILLAVVFPLIQTFGNPKAAKGALIGVGTLVGIFLLSYILSPATTGPLYEKFEIGPTLSKMIGAGLLSFYIFLGIAVLAIIYTSVGNLFQSDK